MIDSGVDYRSWYTLFGHMSTPAAYSIVWFSSGHLHARSTLCVAVYIIIMCSVWDSMQESMGTSNPTIEAIDMQFIVWYMVSLCMEHV